MKRHIALLLASVICLLSFASCSGNKTDSSAPITDTHSPSDTTQDNGPEEPRIEKISGYDWLMGGESSYSDATLTVPAGESVICNQDIPNMYILECDFKVSSLLDSGIVINDVSKYNYYMLYFSSNYDKVNFAQRVNNKSTNNLKTVKLDLDKDEYLHVKLVVFQASVKVYINKAGEDASQIPMIDLPILKYRPNSVAFHAGKEDIQVKNIELKENDVKMAGVSYANPIATGADPYVLCHEGVYYLYSTNAVNEGYKVFTSTDLSTWTDKGLCLAKADVYGNPTSSGGFWAPEVYYYNGLFYMIYTVDEHLGIATSESPLGPFKSPKQSYINNAKREIDGHLFFDDDGKVYIYFVRCASSVGPGTGNEIFGAEFDMETFTYKNERCLVYPSPNTWEWVGNYGYVAEGPAILKHEGRYYLTYSANGYTSQDYAIGLAISDSPLGDYSKYENNPILKKDPYLKVYGPGHHGFTYSPDGKELFIVYHRHQSATSIHTRLTCIDRCMFVYDEKLGYDVLKVIGPTSTAQPLPSGTK